jgi:hypothetical protein
MILCFVGLLVMLLTVLGDDGLVVFVWLACAAMMVAMGLLTAPLARGQRCSRSRSACS